MNDRYDNMTWEEYLQYTDKLREGLDDTSPLGAIDHCVESCREEYRLAWYDYVREFE